MDYIDFARDLISLQQTLRADMPYHINLVDAIGADENANSRILAGILSQHTKDGDYKMLKQFAGAFFGNTLLPSMIDQPMVMTEKAVKNDKRIDIYIYEQGKYAIIMENKVMDAPEQPHQLANYIEGLNELGFDNSQIYVAYLPSTSETTPSVGSWSNRKKYSYEDEFQGRFRNVSFRDSILPWLKTVEIPADDILLQQSVNIYIDYLEGLFGLRPNDHYIEMKTEEYIAKKLGFTDNPIDDLQRGIDAIAELEKLKKELTRGNMAKAHAILKDWLAKAEKYYPDLQWEDRSQNNQFPSIGFPMAYGEWSRAFKVFIQIDPWHNFIYYGIYLAEQPNMPFADAKELLRPTLDNLDKFEYSSGAKMFFAYTKAAEGYERFDKLVKVLLKKLNP